MTDSDQSNLFILHDVHLMITRTTTLFFTFQMQQTQQIHTWAGRIPKQLIHYKYNLTYANILETYINDPNGIGVSYPLNNFENYNLPSPKEVFIPFYLEQPLSAIQSTVTSFHHINHCRWSHLH